MRTLRKGRSSADPDRLCALGLFLGLFSLNAFLVSPYIGWYDSGEMVGTTLCLGISHPSGQALFHILGKIFLILPFQTPAYRLGLMSAFCSALAAGVFFILLMRLADASPDKGQLRIWAFFLTLAWALSQPWWRYSLTPLVYGLHLLLALLVLWAMGLDRPHKWALVFFILGLSTVFRPTQCLALPWAGLFFLSHLRRMGRGRARLGVLSLAGFVLGRSTALYLPLRSALGPELAYGDLTHWRDLLHHLFASRFSGYLGKTTLATVNSVFEQMLSHLWNDLTPFGVAAILFGGLAALRGWRRMPPFLWTAMGWGASEALLVLTIPYPAFESHQVLLGWVFAGLLAGLLLPFLARWSGKSSFRSRFVGFALVLWVLAQGLSIGTLLERKKERGAEDYGRDLLEMMEPNSLYMPAEENEFFPLAGVQQSYGIRKDVGLIEPGSDPSRVAKRIGQTLRLGRPLYVTRKPALPRGWVYRNLGPLLRVMGDQGGGDGGRPLLGARPMARWGKVGLVKAYFNKPSVKAGGWVEVTYQWTRSGPSPCDDTQSVIALLADPFGNYWMRDGVFWFHDIHDPPLGAFGRMRPGSLYEERRILLVPSDFPPGRYKLMVGLQRHPSPLQTGVEVYGREFYERSADQNLGKFMGRGEAAAVVQFTSSESSVAEIGLWPMEGTGGKGDGSRQRFAGTGELEVQPADRTAFAF